MSIVRSAFRINLNQCRRLDPGPLVTAAVGRGEILE